MSDPKRFLQQEINNLTFQINYADLNCIPTFETGADWNIHRQNLEKHFNLKCINDDKRKISVLISTIHRKVYEKLQDLCDPDIPFLKTYEELCEIIEKYYSQKTCLQTLSLKKFRQFRRLKQLSTAESITHWYERVKKAANDCNFGDQLEDKIREQFLIGLVEGKVLDRLLEESPKIPIKDILRVALKIEAEIPAVEKLNEDCLIHIISFLPVDDRIKMEKICKSWRKATKHETIEE